MLQVYYRSVNGDTRAAMAPVPQVQTWFCLCRGRRDTDVSEIWRQAAYWARREKHVVAVDICQLWDIACRGDPYPFSSFASTICSRLKFVGDPMTVALPLCSSKFGLPNLLRSQLRPARILSMGAIAPETCSQIMTLRKLCGALTNAEFGQTRVG